jgi:hypothetical protein
MISISCNTDQTFKASCSWELGLCDRRWGCDKNSNVLENNLTQSIRIMGQNDGSPLHPLPLHLLLSEHFILFCCSREMLYFLPESSRNFETVFSVQTKEKT